MSDVIIKVENLSKRYLIGHQNAKTDGLRHVIEDALRSPWQWFKKRHEQQKNSSEEFWALKDVSFEITRGEVIGIIGRNGAGKSTLLKILSRITEPTSGRITLKGRVASLLEVGTGFHAELTGRENIFLNGAILGMSRAEIKRKFDEIVAFSEVENFLDTPVKRYSSGMYVRLAFAVAAHLEPEVLIVDEVLAVGDAQFQKKCLGKMKDISRGGGRTVLFVSHNMAAVQTLCTSCIVLKGGSKTYSGPVQNGVDSYLEFNEKEGGLEWARNGSPKNADLVFNKASAQLSGTQPKLILQINAEMVSLNPHKPAFLAFDIVDSSGATIMQSLPELEPFILSSNRIHKYCVKIELMGLIPGRYSLTLWAGSHNTETLDVVEEALWFEVVDSPTLGRSFPHSRNHGAIAPISSIRELPD